MIIEQLIRNRDVRLVPLAPVAGLVPCDKQNRMPLRVKGEQDPQFRPATRPRAQFLHVPVPRTNHGIDERTSKLRSTLSKKLQRSDHLLVRKHCARGWTRTAFGALKTQGTPENMPSTSPSGRGTAEFDGQRVHIVHTPFSGLRTTNTDWSSGLPGHHLNPSYRT